MSLKPASLDSFSKVLEHFEAQGFSEDDIITLIHKKTRPKIPITAVRATIAAIKAFEKQIEKALNQD